MVAIKEGKGKRGKTRGRKLHFWAADPLHRLEQAYPEESEHMSAGFDDIWSALVNEMITKGIACVADVVDFVRAWKAPVASGERTRGRR